jgi:hypothetical protein
MDLTYEFLLQPNVKSDAYFIGSSNFLARRRRASARQAAPSYLVRNSCGTGGARRRDEQGKPNRQPPHTRRRRRTAARWYTRKTVTQSRYQVKRTHRHVPVSNESHTHTSRSTTCPQKVGSLELFWDLSIELVALVEFESEEFEHFLCSYHCIRCIDLSSSRGFGGVKVRSFYSWVLVTLNGLAWCCGFLGASS